MAGCSGIAGRGASPESDDSAATKVDRAVAAGFCSLGHAEALTIAPEFGLTGAADFAKGLTGRFSPCDGFTRSG
jgi:hypothetical protein